ncbi:MAG: formate dehydrogenase subunit gamma [Lysobacterales bacterium]|nr:MAG: formate dehydrogenase subunit gamma [Xanthomonadales bacterium]
MQSDTPHAEPLDARALEHIERALADHAAQPGPLLLVLHAVQHRLGYIPPSAVAVIANALNLSRAEVHGVITFYHFFRQRPAGRHLVQLCQAEACKSMRGEQLTAHASRRLGIDLHQTTRDGAVSLEPVYCLGNCACAPSVMIDGELYGRVTAERFDALIDRAARVQE